MSKMKPGKEIEIEADNTISSNAPYLGKTNFFLNIVLRVLLDIRDQQQENIEMGKEMFKRMSTVFKSNEPEH